MKKLCILVLGLAAFGCSGGGRDAEVKRTAPNAQTSAGSPASETAAAPADPSDPASQPAATAVDPNNPAAPATGEPEVVRGSLADIKNRKFGKSAFENAPGSGQPPRIIPQPAPEDSEFTAVLQDVAVETRTFRSHPQLWKVEKRSDGKNSIAKVFLRDERVIDVPGSKLERLATVSSADILKAAGIQSNEAPAPNRGQKNQSAND